MVEFYDYNCPYCRASLPAVEKFYQQHKNDTRFSFIEFPIKGPDHIVAARVALAARLQPDKYLALHFPLMNETDPVNEQMIYADAQKAGLNMAKLKADMESPASTPPSMPAKTLALTAPASTARPPSSSMAWCIRARWMTSAESLPPRADPIYGSLPSATALLRPSRMKSMSACPLAT